MRYACDDLLRVQILGENPNCSTLRGGRDNEGIPESDLGFVLNSKRRRDFRRGGFDAPNGITVHDESCHYLWAGETQSSRVTLT